MEVRSALGRSLHQMPALTHPGVSTMGETLNGAMDMMEKMMADAIGTDGMGMTPSGRRRLGYKTHGKTSEKKNGTRAQGGTIRKVTTMISTGATSTWKKVTTDAGVSFVGQRFQWLVI
jgi:hypothetical protein